MVITEIILNYLKLIFSWPVAFFIIMIVFLFKYRDSLNKLIENIKSVKAAGVEVIAQTKTEEPDVEKEDINKKVIDNLLHQLGTLELEKGKIVSEAQTLIWGLYNEAEFYKFSFLNLLFVANTKIILKWFNDISETTKEIYKSSWRPIIKNEEQLDIILSVLLNFKMVEENDINVRITEDGRKFLIFINMKSLK